MAPRSFESLPYLIGVATVTVAVAVTAFLARDGTLAFSAAILGLYLLHLMSIRFIMQAQQEQRGAMEEHWELLQQLVGSSGTMRPSTNGSTPRAPYTPLPGPETEGTPRSYTRTVESAGPKPRFTGVPIPRHFALGTVALVRGVLEPAQVAQILLEQRKRPDLKFGEVAVDLGAMTESQLETLLLTQQEGLFTDEEIRNARLKLERFRHSYTPTAAD